MSQTLPNGLAARVRARARRSTTVALTAGLAGVALAGPAGAALLPLPTATIVPPTVASVQASIAQAQAAATALTDNGKAFAATIQAIAAGAPDDPEGAIAALQAATTAEASSLEGVALAQALALAAKVTAPTCSTLATITAATPSTSLIAPANYALLGPLATPVANQDRNVADAVQQHYVDAFTKLLTPVTLPPAAAQAQGYVTLAQTLLGLLKINWHTTSYSTTGVPFVRDTPAFLNLPMFLEVDGRTGVDVCATFGLDLGTGVITQSIARLPWAPQQLPLDIQGQFLGGVVAPGYETKTSGSPAGFETSMSLAGAPLDTRLVQPRATFTQTHSLTSALQYRWASQNPATAYKWTSGTAGGTGGNGTAVTYSADKVAASFSYALVLGSINLGIAQTPAATAFQYCTSAKGFCSNEPASATTTEKSSMHFVANQVVKVDQTGSAGSTTCPSLAILGDAHLTGSKLYLGVDSTAANGHAWIDTGGQPISGCLATASTTGTLPAGFAATGRNVTWAGTGTAPATSKTGTITCPSGTTLTGGSAGIAFGLARYLCSVPPVNTVAPSIAGQAFVGATLTAANGTWTPGAPNLPTFTYQWQRCSAAGTGCAAIPGETAASYNLPVGSPPSTSVDLGTTLRAIVTATNLDGTSTVSTATTPIVQLPPPPVNTVRPVVSGTLGSGNVLGTTNGTWTNGTSGGFTYQWQQCSEGGTGCTDLAGATASTYVPTAADEAHGLQVVVTAANLGGTGTATSNLVLIPGTPTNIDLPLIRNGSSVASGASVLTGDHLKVGTGTWTYATRPFTYQWQRCAADGTSCTDIPGATLNAYVVTDDDLGSVLTVKVDGHNPNAAPNGLASVNSPATGVVLANNQQLQPSTIVPDGSVLATAPGPNGGSVVGGRFDTVGPLVGGAGAVGLAAAAGPAGTATTLGADARGGDVKASLVDGNGGYFIGGSFTSVLGTPCPALAHITSTGALDPAYCGTGIVGEVRALSASTLPGGTAKVLAIGGLFTVAGHANLAFLDPAAPSALLFPVDGDPNGAVNSITNNSAASGGGASYFLGGDFTAVGSAPAGGLALEVVTGSPVASIGRTTAWPAAVCTTTVATGPCTSTGSVRTVGYSTLGVILVGGRFNAAYKTTDAPGTATVVRNNAYAPSASTGTAAAWNPNAGGAVNTIVGGAVSSALGPYTLYLGGEFTSLGGNASIKYLGEFGITLTSGNPAASAAATNAGGPSTTFVPVLDGPVTTLVPGIQTGTTTATLSQPLYVGGSFKTAFGQVRHRVLMIGTRTSTTTAAPTLDPAFDPNAGADVLTMTRDGANLIVGGRFAVLGGITRENVAEIGVGGATSWNPGVTGTVRSIAVDGSTTYLGGSFTAAGGAARANLAAISAAGTATAWNPGADGAVDALSIGAGTVQVGGAFATVGGQARANLAQVDDGGSVTSWNPGTDGPVKALATKAGTTYVGGAFTTAGGQSRANVAAIDAGGLVTGWDPGTDGPVNALATTGDGVVLGGSFGTAGGAPRTNLAQVDAAGTTAAWAPSTDGAVNALLVVGNTVYAGGAFTSFGGAPRIGVAAIAADDDTNLGGFDPGLDGPVSTLTLTAGGSLVIGGTFGSVGSVRKPHLAFFGG